MRVIKEHGYVKVVRGKDNKTIGAGRLDDKRVVDFEFCEDRYRRSNKTRQAAMTALQREGYV